MLGQCRALKCCLQHAISKSRTAFIDLIPLSILIASRTSFDVKPSFSSVPKDESFGIGVNLIFRLSLTLRGSDVVVSLL